MQKQVVTLVSSTKSSPWCSECCKFMRLKTFVTKCRNNIYLISSTHRWGGINRRFHTLIFGVVYLPLERLYQYFIVLMHVTRNSSWLAMNCNELDTAMNRLTFYCGYEWLGVLEFDFPDFLLGGVKNKAVFLLCETNKLNVDTFALI